MKISEYIKTILEAVEKGEVTFDIGTDDGNNVNSESPNRIKFTVIKS